MDSASRKKRKIKRIVGLCVCGVLVIVFALAAYFTIAISGEIRGKNVSEETGVITVEKGDNTTKIGDKLKEAGIIKYPTAFRFYAKFTGCDTNIQLGAFEFKKGESYENIFADLNKSQYRESVSLTFPEGYRVSQIVDKLVAAGIGTEQGFYDAINNDFYSYDYLPDAGTENRLEGFLYPDTYAFFVDDTEHNIINKMLKRFDDVITENKIKDKLGDMTLYEAVTLASIIQKEGGTVGDFANISSVFHNRMKIGMKLQSDATITYVLKKEDVKTVLSYADLQTDSPYNTYLHEGLTPTPIANPGIDALIAAVEPAQTEYYYFVAKLDGTGESVFSKTYKEHLKNSKKYLG